MFKRILGVAIFLLLLGSSSALFAQSNTAIVVELVPAQAAKGETVTANVWVQNGVNIAGADLGINVDQCLRVIGKTQGAFLPDANNGGFVVFDQTTDTSARLAVAITDRTKIANGDDIFYSAQMEVLCDSGSAEVTLEFAELSAYVDPAAEQIELIAYTKEAGNLSTTGATLAIGSPDPVIEEPVIEEPVIEEPVVDEPVVDQPVVDNPDPVIDPVSPNILGQLTTMTGLSLNMLMGILAAIVFLIVFMLGRRRRRRS